MIDAVLPRSVRHAEAFEDDASLDGLFPEERVSVAKAVAKRQREFATVRRCARDALVELGMPRLPLLRRADGSPAWPVGIVGSMTHCAGYRAAAVARNNAFAAIGIDAEPDEPLPGTVLDLIALPADRDALDVLPGDGPAWDRILFSAKESIYKVWFPLARTFLAFEDAAVAIDRDGTFTAQLLVAGPTVGGCMLDRIHGRWLAARGLVVTTVVLPR